MSAILLFGGCVSSMTPTQKGAVGGAAIGAVAGQLIGGNTAGTLIGAGVGALGGALMNDALDNEKKGSAIVNDSNHNLSLFKKRRRLNEINSARDAVKHPVG